MALLISGGRDSQCCWWIVTLKDSDSIGWRVWIIQIREWHRICISGVTRLRSSWGIWLLCHTMLCTIPSKLIISWSHGKWCLLSMSGSLSVLCYSSMWPGMNKRKCIVCGNKECMCPILLRFWGVLTAVTVVETPILMILGDFQASFGRRRIPYFIGLDVLEWGSTHIWIWLSFLVQVVYTVLAVVEG